MSAATSAYPLRSAARRKLRDRLFVAACIVVAGLSLAMLVVLLTTILKQGMTFFRWDFLNAVPSRRAAKAGIGPAMWGSIWVCVICALTALPLGVGTAIFLEEFKPRRRWPQRIHGFIQLNISNLAGVPSIVYGILGLTLFVQCFNAFGNANKPDYEFGIRYFDQFTTNNNKLVTVRVADRDAEPTVPIDAMPATDADGNRGMLRIAGSDGSGEAGWTVAADAKAQRINHKSWYYVQLPFGRGVLAGGLTLMLVVLPIIIVASQESLRAVPNSLREGAMALGSTPWKVVARMTLPAAVPGIMTGSILAMSRAIGEAAPMLVIAGVVYITFTPKHLMDEFTVMPLQIYNWAGLPQDDFHQVAATGIIVLLAVLLTFNAIAVFIRQSFQKPLS